MAQRLTDITNSIAQSLLHHGVDTVLIYSPYECPTSYRPTDTSLLEDIKYVITKNADLLSIERLTYEYPYNHGLIVTHNFVLKKDTFGIFKFIKANFVSIISDTLLPGFVKYKHNGKDTLARTLGSHPCYTELIIKISSGTYKNGMIDADLNNGIIRNVDGSFRSSLESINYEHNTSTTIYKIISKLQLLEMEVQRTFQF